MNWNRRRFINRTAMLAATIPLAARSGEAHGAGQVLTPEMFGAKGDGQSNDTAAFARLAARINQLGGGTIRFRKTTYLVGIQVPGQPGARWSFDSTSIIDLKGLIQPLVVDGNGARMRAAPGLRFGTFDREGRPTKRPMPNLKVGELATPYHAMIFVTGCSAPVKIRNLELDGNIDEMQIGGPYGDTGRQIPMNGLFLRDNTEEEVVLNLHSHHHGLDGVIIDGDSARTARSRFDGLVSEHNGRQGVSIVGGRGYDFTNSKFRHTGSGPVSSAPGAGVDIEAEGKKINRDFSFTDCEFVDNYGCGMVADSGDSEGATFRRCKFVGSQTWAAWPRKPHFRFEDCTFLGPIVQCHQDNDPARATQFHNCRFLDDPKLSPAGGIWASGGANAIADLGAGSRNVLFHKCTFELTHQLVLPWSWHAIYSDCRMRQTSQQQAYPKGTYIGTNSIVGNVNMYGTRVLGSLTVNGKPLVTGNPLK